MSKEKQAAQEILKHIGGQENILNVEHCATRLRLVLKDASEFDKKEIEAIDGVKGSFFASGQHQIILGTGFVNKVYQQVLEITGMDTGKMMSKAEAAAVNMNAGCNRTFYGTAQSDHQSGSGIKPHIPDTVTGSDRHGIFVPAGSCYIFCNETVWRIPCAGYCDRPYAGCTSAAQCKPGGKR